MAVAAQLGRGAQPGPLERRPSPAAGPWWGRGVQHGVGRQPGGERDRCGQVPPGRALVGGIGDHVHPPVGERRGQQPDQLAGLGGLGRARAGQVQPQQQRQAHIAVGEGHRHDQPGDHETVPAADPVAALRGPIMLPRRAEHAAPVAMEQGVIHRHGQRLAVGGGRGQHQPGQGQPQRVGVPAGVGEESVRP